ncbi:hypothetical protein K501DRAFT_269704 [Backusella circina FSU 941]|nr:hypothetical protein K501DRAFT_269704 [Backusella circina FSU 941]
MTHVLPFEIIFVISSYLDFKGKLNLMLICRTLYQLISKTNLYEELNLLDRNYKTDAMVKNLGRSKHFVGAQVVLIGLADIFPNVTKVHISKRLLQRDNDEVTIRSPTDLQDSDLKGPIRAKFDLIFLQQKERYIQIYDYEKYEDDEDGDGMKEVYRSTINAYRTSGFRFLASLPKSLNTLKLNLKVFDNIIEAIAESNMNITTLIFDYSMQGPYKFREPAQLSRFKELTLITMLQAKFDKAIQNAYNQDLMSTSITKLVLELSNYNYKEGVTVIDWLLSMFPSLKELYLNPCHNYYNGIDFSPGMVSGKIHLNLQILSLIDSDVSCETFYYIKRVTPNLKVLYWMMGDNHTDMNLIGWNLYKCELLISSQKDIECCSVTIQGITRDLCVDLNRQTLLSHPVSNTLFGKRGFSFTCDYIKHLKICDFTIRKYENEITIVL